MKKIVLFFKECYAELRKVVWPSRDEAISATKVVIVSTVVIAIVMGLVDLVLNFGINYLF